MKSQLLFYAFLFLSSKIFAQWTNNSAINSPVCVTSGNQTLPVITTDGSGGAIIVWQDSRSSNSSIYVQRINSNGFIQWTLNGINSCSAFGSYSTPAIVSDGSGGAIITWTDTRNGVGNNDIFAQRVNGSGVVQWTTNGATVCTATNIQEFPAIISDGNHGAIITWSDRRNGTSTYQVYAQHLDAGGTAQWATNGVNICSTLAYEAEPKLADDGNSGAIIAWSDSRNTTVDIYAQRVNSGGVVQWASNGILICNAADDQSDVQITSNGNSGAFISWVDMRTTIAPDIYAQNINSSGVVQWTTNGVPVCTASSDQNGVRMVSDGSNGVILSWYDTRPSATFDDIYAQRLNSSGVAQWATNGVLVCTDSDDQGELSMVKDASGGAIIAWIDYRTGSNTDVYAQRINSSGVRQWTATGVAIATATGEQGYPQLVSDGSGGAIITWPDRRNGNDYDVYTQWVMSNGNLSLGTEDFQLVDQIEIQPNPSNGLFTLTGLKLGMNLQVFNWMGQMIYSQVCYKDIESMNLTQLPKGNYFIRIQYNLDNSSNQGTKKICIE